MSTRTICAAGWAAALALSSCSAEKTRSAAARFTPITGPEGDLRLRSFDLVPREIDANGFFVNPEWGWSFTRREKCARAGTLSGDPAACSWQFGGEKAAPPRSGKGNLPICNSWPMAPDFSDNTSTWLVGITCSDSPLLYPGHLNWGEAYRGAVTYKGLLSWDEYASDGDYNFILDPESEGGLAPGVPIGIEINSADFNVKSDWFTRFRTAVIRGDEEKIEEVVGTREAIVTGLLGIDAEHMSSKNLNVELHPVYAMAVRLDEPGGDTWAFFVRDQSDEGFCSHRSRPHAVVFDRHRYVFDLPLDCSSAGIPAVTSCNLDTGRGGQEAPELSLEIDRKQAVVRMIIQLPPGGFVDGQIHFKCRQSLKSNLHPADGGAAEERRRLFRAARGHDTGEGNESAGLKEAVTDFLARDGGLGDELALEEEVNGDRVKCGQVIDGGVQFVELTAERRFASSCDMPVPNAFLDGGTTRAALDLEMQERTAKPPPVEKASPERTFCGRNQEKSEAVRRLCAAVNR
jgi:hypothetical protein